MNFNMPPGVSFCQRKPSALSTIQHTRHENLKLSNVLGEYGNLFSDGIGIIKQFRVKIAFQYNVEKREISKMKNGRHVRWAVLLSQYNYKIKYIAGTQPYYADILLSFPVCDLEYPSDVPAQYVNLIRTEAIAQANGLAERFIRAFKDKPLDKNRILKFLLTYRNTPHSTTGKEPTRMMMGRCLPVHFDSIREQSKEITEKSQTQKQYKDTKAKYRKFVPGQKVWTRSAGWQSYRISDGTSMRNHGNLIRTGESYWDVPLTTSTPNKTYEGKKKVKGIDNVLIVFSHDLYDKDINKVIQDIKFAPVIHYNCTKIIFLEGSNQTVKKFQNHQSNN
ncbi:hypothetical protein GJ496_011852 [Pomphorhynchus laevis]|nr:hypothetical protein GJ496_011852 [Pomphorhynchus laevis]